MLVKGESEVAFVPGETFGDITDPEREVKSFDSRLIDALHHVRLTTLQNTSIRPDTGRLGPIKPLIISWVDETLIGKLEGAIASWQQKTPGVFVTKYNFEDKVETTFGVPTIDLISFEHLIGRIPLKDGHPCTVTEMNDQYSSSWQNVGAGAYKLGRHPHAVPVLIPATGDVGPCMLLMPLSRAINFLLQQEEVGNSPKA